MYTCLPTYFSQGNISCWQNTFSKGTFMRMKSKKNNIKLMYLLIKLFDIIFECLSILMKQKLLTLFDNEQLFLSLLIITCKKNHSWKNIGNAIKCLKELTFPFFLFPSLSFSLTVSVFHCSIFFYDNLSQQLVHSCALLITQRIHE